MSGKNIRAGKAEVSLEIQDKLQAGLTKAENRLKTFGKGLTRIGGGIAAIGATVGGAFIPAIAKASEFQERMSKFQVVFGQNSAAVKKWGDHFAAEVGRSKSQVVDFLASTQDLLVPLGFEWS